MILPRKIGCAQVAKQAAQLSGAVSDLIFFIDAMYDMAYSLHYEECL